MSLRRALVAWASLCVVGWLIVGGALVGSESSCDESTSLLCFTPRDVWLATGMFAAAWLFAGLLVIAVVTAVHRRVKAARAPPDA